MWMYFNSDKAFKFLSRYWIIYTLRPIGKRKPAERVIVDIRHHSKKKQFKALRFFEGKVTFDDEILKEKVKYSGFKNIEEWKAEARKIIGTDKGSFNLFKVIRICDEYEKE